MTSRSLIRALGLAAFAALAARVAAEDKAAPGPHVPLAKLAAAVLDLGPAGPAIEARINLYLHCDKREDNLTEQTDEIYLAGSFVGPDGKSRLIKAGPHDFRDGGGSERWRDFHRLGVCDLRPGEQVTGTIKVMENDGGFGEVIDLVSQAVQIGLIGNETPEAQVARAVAKVAGLLGKGGDDEIVTVNFTVTNVDGRLVTRAWSNSPGVDDQGAKVIDVHGRPVTFHAMRVKNGFDYHLRFWAGPDRDNH